MASDYIIKLDGYQFPFTEVPFRGPLDEQSEQIWSEQPVLGNALEILTFIGNKSQQWDMTIPRASQATVDKIKSVYGAKVPVTLVTPQNTAGFQVLMTRYNIPHEEPAPDGTFLVRFTLRSRQLAVGLITPSEGDDELIIVKQADQPKASDITTAADTELVVPVLANEVWAITWYIFYDTESTPGFKFDLGVPAGTNGLRMVVWDEVSPTSENAQIKDNSFSPDQIILGDGTRRPLKVDAIFEVGGTAGNIEFRWAQNVSDAANTIVLQYSYLRATKQ